MILATVAASLTGCGFRPLYAPHAGHAAAADLATVHVAIIPERFGQEIRQSLQQRLQGGNAGSLRRYQLTVQPSLSEEGIAIQPDSSVTRIRVIGSATFLLRRLEPPGPVLTSGTSRAIDGINLVNNQYFASDLDNDVVQRRIADMLADQITAQLAIWFNRQARVARKA